MAGYNEILSGRYNRCLQKLLSMKGQASTNELASTIQPNFQFAWGNEMRFLESWNRFGIGQQVGPQAAQLNSFQLRNKRANRNSHTRLPLFAILKHALSPPTIEKPRDVHCCANHLPNVAG